MRKPIAYALLAIAATAGIFLVGRNQRIVKNELYYQTVSKYVYAYTGNGIGSRDIIRVRFVDAAAKPDQVGKEVESGIFTLEPAVKGRMFWEDDRTIKVEPEGRLPYGEHYVGRVALNRLFTDVPHSARRFDFDFYIQELEYKVVTAGFSADPDNPGSQRINGRVEINEPIEAEKVEKMLVAEQGGNALKINWTHDPEGRNHQWEAVGVVRTPAASSVALRWKGEAIGAKQDKEEEQTVPAAGDFEVLSLRAVQLEEQYILVNFSDPVSTSQDLNGLIRIENYGGKLRFVTEANFVRVYPDTRITGAHKVIVDKNIRSAAGQALKSGIEWTIQFEDLNPGVRLVGRGAIIPQQSNGGVIFPFEAVGLNAVDVEVFKIFNSNILQFLQVNELEGTQELQRVGKIIYQKKINLKDINPNAASRNWQRYALDLKDMINEDPGAIYNVRIAFQQPYSDCATAGGAVADAGNNTAAGGNRQVIELNRRDDDGNLISIMGGWNGRYFGGYDENYEEYYEGEYDGEYSYDDRENPCEPEYYNRERFVARNAFVSDLGITSKRGRDGSVFVAVTDLHTAQPVSNIDIEMFSYQLQSIVNGKTGADGTLTFEKMRETAFLAVASGPNRRGYLRMADGSALSLSRFDVAGVEAQKGLKGYIYGERGVWRPGDSLFLNFVLEDKSGKLPQGHPVTMELTDPRGSVQYRTVTTHQVNGVYALHCFTRPDAPTGVWTCKVMAGGATFSQALKIETVKPNRLKIDLNFGKQALAASEENPAGTLKVNWLHGAPAQGLKAKVEMILRAGKTAFPNFKDFSFDDPTREFYSEPQTVFDQTLDDKGTALVPLQLGDLAEAPGKLTASFKIRAFEAGGDFSTDNFSMDYHPYDQYVGVSTPTGRWGGKTIDMRGGNVRIALVDRNGKPLANKEVNAALYRCDWRWWWDSDAQSGVAQFNSGETANAVDQKTLTTDARGLVSWFVRPNDWGRFLVRVTDNEGGHAAGDFFWSGYPGDLQDIKSRNSAAMLTFSVEKEKYNVGEEVTLRVPASENGRILLTLETGSRVAKHLWFDAKAGENVLKFTTDASMTPTVYAHVSLIQPHAQTKNDLPIRMYGVMPVNVENPAARLEAQLDMPDVLRPEEPFNINIREKSGKACTYTIAVVDEGLLDLTRFKTPNPFDAFYAREALGVKTWDVYDFVLGAYGVELERILAVGGDGINQKAKSAQINRFKPVVKHIGPFFLPAGRSVRHTLQIDNYVGSVRVMAVLSSPAVNAYGNTEKTCPVRKPLMILPTLPRVLGPGESLRLPVDVFAMEKKVQNAVITAREKTGLVTISNGSNTLNFSEPGQKMTWFDLKVGNKTGVARFTVTAEGAGEKATSDIEIEIRNPNPMVTNVIEASIEPGKEWSQTIDASAYSNIQNAMVEVSILPSINMSRHLDYLIQYPHGCLEQTTSAAFPQLYVDMLAPLSDKQKENISKHVTAAINKIRRFQTGSGGFSYWPGESYVNTWANSYAGHFLLEAKSRGYAVPDELVGNWITSQINAARSWNRSGNDYYHDDLTQAYRLYTLALAGQPALADMNRMREVKDLYEESAAMLAAAYARSGKPEAARELVARNWVKRWTYQYCGYTYGSDLRDRSLLLETYTDIGDKARANAVATFIGQEIGRENSWYWNTQSLATCLRAIAHYVNKNYPEGPSYTYKMSGGTERTGDSSRPFSTADITDLTAKNGTLTIKNTSSGKLNVRIAVSGAPITPPKQASASNIAMSIRYTDLKGQQIDPGKIKQGSDFVAEVTVRRNSNFNFNFEEMALSQIFPSGWEITNTRMDGNINNLTNSAMDYQDVRDDRVLTYFDIPANYGNNQPNAMVYRIQLNAAYIGRYYLPAVACEAMYDNRIRALLPGTWVEVI